MSNDAERRTARRLPLALPACVTGESGEGPVHGMVRDASPVGVLLELREPERAVTGCSRLEIGFPSGTRILRTQEIRREATARGGLRVALRLLEPPGRAPASPVLPLPTAPPGRGPRPRSVVRADLRALGAAAYDLATEGPGAAVPPALAAWATALAEEAGAPRAAPATVDDLATLVEDLWRSA